MSSNHSNSTVNKIQTALITGGAGGIGKEIAKYLISQNKKVIIVGRTESKLQSAAKEIGATAYYVLDTGATQSIKPFVSKLLKEHPDLNCLINNAGVQRPFQFPGVKDADYGFDLEKADQEIDINIRGPMHLVVELLPHFMSLDHESVILNVTSVLGYNPSSIINPVYNGTKAWLHFFTLNMRTQLSSSSQSSKKEGTNGEGNKESKLKIVELIPPTVSTDLHRERVDPDDNKKEKSSSALSLDEFMQEVRAGLERGDDSITAGPGKELVKTWEGSMGEKYRGAVGA